MKLPKQDRRAETGVVKFGDDWAGLFIRGDDCANYLSAFKKMRHDNPHLAEFAPLNGMIEMLEEVWE